MAGRVRRVAGGGRRGTRPSHPRRACRHGGRASHGLDARLVDALRQHHRRRPAGRVSRRPRDRGAPRVADALERARDGGAREPWLRRTRWPHRELRERGRPVRSRLQPLLPRAHGEPRRRPDLLPAAQRTGRLCARVPRRAPERGRPQALPTGADRAGLRGCRWRRQRRARPVQLSASVPDAGLLAVPDRLDGDRADQLDLPRALHALPDRPQAARLPRAQGVGRLRRRRDGRTRVDERADARGAREARQPGVGRQLQPAAARRAGARQRSHHRRARAPVRGRRLERDQADLGQRLGRPVRARHDARAGTHVRRDGRRPDADLRREGRALQPRKLLRAERRTEAARAGHDRRPDRSPQARRPRPREDPCGLRRGRRASRTADRDPRAHQEGLRDGCGPGPHDDPLAQEVRERRPDRLSQPLRPAADRRRGDVARVLQAGRRQRRDALPEARIAKRSAARCRDARPRARSCSRRRSRATRGSRWPRTTRR